MGADISRVGDRRHADDRCGATTMWLCAIGCIVMLALGMPVAPLATEAQSRLQSPQVGFLHDSHQVDELQFRHLEDFQQGLRDFGYVEGQNIHLEVRWSEGRPDRLHELAAERCRPSPVRQVIGRGETISA
jgi:hypothetical protein